MSLKPLSYQVYQTSTLKLGMVFSFLLAADLMMIAHLRQKGKTYKQYVGVCVHLG